MSKVDEFKKKVVGRKITWHNWESHEYILVSDIEPNGSILTSERSCTYAGQCVIAYGLHIEHGWRFYDTSYNITLMVDELINIANAGRDAANELFEKYSNHFKIAENYYVKIKKD